VNMSRRTVVAAQPAFSRRTGFDRRGVSLDQWVLDSRSRLIGSRSTRHSSYHDRMTVPPSILRYKRARGWGTARRY
jgi:hypothetical protein